MRSKSDNEIANELIPDEQIKEAQMKKLTERVVTDSGKVLELDESKILELERTHDVRIDFPSAFAPEDSPTLYYDKKDQTWNPFPDTWVEGG